MKTRLIAGTLLVALCSCATPADPQVDREPSGRITGFTACRTAVMEPVERSSRMGWGYRAHVNLMTDNVVSWMRRLKLIENAKLSIVAQYYIIETDPFGLAFLGGLLKKQLQGVQVTLMIDAFGSRRLAATTGGQDYLQELVAAGAEVVVYAPIVATGRPRLFGSNHDKILIVDQCHYVTGGRNIGAGYFTSLKQDPAAYSDADFHAEDAASASEMLGAFMSEFELRRNYKVKRDRLGNWRSRKDELLAAYERHLRNYSAFPLWERLDRPRDPGLIRVFDNESKLHGRDNMRNATYALEELILEARREIVIANPYVVPTPELVEAFIRAGEKGVKITLLTNSPVSTTSTLSQATFVNEWPDLVRRVRGLRIFVSKGPDELHSKMLAIDGVLSLVGTYNFDSLSDHINSEEFVVVQSEAVAAEMSDYIQKFIESNTVEYRIVDGQLRGPEQLNDPAALRRVRRLEGISRRFRDKL